MNLVGHLGHKDVLILFTFNLIIKCGISHFSLSFSPVLSAQEHMLSTIYQTFLMLCGTLGCPRGTLNTLKNCKLCFIGLIDIYTRFSLVCQALSELSVAKYPQLSEKMIDN